MRRERFDQLAHAIGAEQVRLARAPRARGQHIGPRQSVMMDDVVQHDGLVTEQARQPVAVGAAEDLVQARAAPVAIDQQNAPAIAGQQAAERGDHDGLAFRRRGGAEQDGLGRGCRFRQFDADLHAAQRFAVGRGRLSQHLHGRRCASADLWHHGQHRQASEGLDLVGAAERLVAALAQERDRRSQQQSANGAQEGDQRLGRIGRRLARCRRRHQLGVGLQDVLGTRALLDAIEHRFQKVAIDYGVAFQRLESDRLVVDLAHLALELLEVLAERLVARIGGPCFALKALDGLGDLRADLATDVGRLGPGVEHLRMAFAVHRLHLCELAIGLGLLLLQRGDQG